MTTAHSGPGPSSLPIYLLIPPLRLSLDAFSIRKLFSPTPAILIISELRSSCPKTDALGCTAL